MANGTVLQFIQDQLAHTDKTMRQIAIKAGVNPSTVKKINNSLPVEVDIGINFDNAKKLAGAGADFLVSSSALYNEPDFRVAFEKMSKLAK